MRILSGKLLAAMTLFALSATASPDEAAKATNALAIKLLQASEPGNAAFSPYSIQLALAMVYAGAEGDTRTQMVTALKYPTSDMAPAFGALQTQIQSTKGKTDLVSANRLFGQSGYQFNPAYLSLVKKIFGSEMQELDFRQPAPAAKKINAWIEDSTRKRIRDLVSRDGLRGARLVLANAIYFKASWATPFNKDRTISLPFHQADGKVIDTPTMVATEFYGLAKHADFSLVTLPYADRDLQLIIILPEAGQSLSSIEHKLNAGVFKEFAQLKAQKIVLFLPRFKMEPPTWSLGPTLKGFGMPSAFDSPKGSANFNGIAPRKPDDYLYISQVLHKCFVEVNEEGTEAAAATALVMLAGAAMPAAPPPEIHIDRPFLFAIQHRPTGACLFLGRVTDPTR
ncbi:serpin family protein [soil metagenome]